MCFTSASLCNILKRSQGAGLGQADTKASNMKAKYLYYLQLTETIETTARNLFLANYLLVTIVFASSLLLEPLLARDAPADVNRPHNSLSQRRQAAM